MVISDTRVHHLCSLWTINTELKKKRFYVLNELQSIEREREIPQSLCQTSIFDLNDKGYKTVYQSPLKYMPQMNMVCIWRICFLQNECCTMKSFFFISMDLLMVVMLCYSPFSDIWKKTLPRRNLLEWPWVWYSCTLILIRWTCYK